MSEKKKESGINRRDFMWATAAAGAGLLLTPMISTRTAKAQTDAINVAIIGAGAEGRILLESAVKIPGVRFKALCDIWTQYNQRNQSRFLKAYKHEHNVYVDYKEMLDKETDLDAAIIATPDFWHSPQTVACLEKGLHVYCEKEMSNTLDGAKKMLEAAEASGKLLQIGHQRRSNPRYRHCYEKLIKEAKILGRMTTINGQWNRAARPFDGYPEKYAMDQASLEQYGFKSMEQFRNWRWFKGLGGGPIVDLGSHQIDIFTWFVGVNPATVIASGGTDYYDKTTHEWYDTVMAIYTYDAPEGTVRAFYQTITTNSNQGYYETFMGDEGTLVISESASRGAAYREKTAPEWDKWVKAGYLNEPKKPAAAGDEASVMDARETIAPDSYEIPIEFTDPYHKPHLENFFNAIRGTEQLNCPAEVGYETAVAVLKVNEAVEANCRLDFKPEEFTI
jgi:predicted dehydrogenase